MLESHLLSTIRGTLDTGGRLSVPLISSNKYVDSSGGGRGDGVGEEDVVLLPPPVYFRVTATAAVFDAVALV